MFKAIALVIWLAGMQCLQVVSTDVSGGTPPPEGDGRQPADSVSARALRIVRVIEVTDGSAHYMQPIWSPDGRKLAFTKFSFTGIYVRNADGSGPIREMTSALYSGYKPVWTSDSKALVLRIRTGKIGKSITSIDVETGEVTTIVERAAHPNQPKRNIYGDVTINVDGETKVLNQEGDSLDSMDGYYSEERPSSLDVNLEMDYRNDRLWINEGGQLRRTEFPHQVLLASLSPVRDRVLVRLRDGNWYVSRFDGSMMVNLGRGAHWDWSLDGTKLVYLGDIREDHYNVIAADILVVNADGSGVTKLTDTPDIIEDYPRWSPDGLRIAYSTYRAGKICVAVLEEVR